MADEIRRDEQTRGAGPERQGVREPQPIERPEWLAEGGSRGASSRAGGQERTMGEPRTADEPPGFLGRVRDAWHRIRSRD